MINFFFFLNTEQRLNCNQHLIALLDQTAYNEAIRYRRLICSDKALTDLLEGAKTMVSEVEEQSHKVYLKLKEESPSPAKR